SDGKKKAVAPNSAKTAPEARSQRFKVDSRRTSSTPLAAKIASAKTAATANFSGYRRGSGDRPLPQLAGTRLGATERTRPPRKNAFANRSPGARVRHVRTRPM